MPVHLPSLCKSAFLCIHSVAVALPFLHVVKKIVTSNNEHDEIQ